MRMRMMMTMMMMIMVMMMMIMMVMMMTMMMMMMKTMIHSCEEGEFTCSDGECILMKERCDQVPHIYQDIFTTHSKFQISNDFLKWPITAQCRATKASPINQ